MFRLNVPKLSIQSKFEMGLCKYALVSGLIVVMTQAFETAVENNAQEGIIKGLLALASKAALRTMARTILQPPPPPPPFGFPGAYYYVNSHNPADKYHIQEHLEKTERALNNVIFPVLNKLGFICSWVLDMVEKSVESFFNKGNNKPDSSPPDSTSIQADNDDSFNSEIPIAPPTPYYLTDEDLEDEKFGIESVPNLTGS